MHLDSRSHKLLGDWLECKTYIRPTLRVIKELQIRQYHAVDDDSPLLSQAMTPILSLAVNLGVEVHVMEDDCVCPCQVQALAASTGAEQKGKDAC